MFTKKEALEDIDKTQDGYVADLARLIEEPNETIEGLSEIDFTSPTGTGKTIMVAKLINRMPDYFFVVTSLSRGQLRFQIEAKLKELVKQDNFIVFGLNEYTTTTKLQRAEIESRIQWDKKVIWIRDEGHIATNRWAEILRKKAYLTVNFSATNKFNRGIQCNFAHTMMLRTVSQGAGTPEDALDKLLDVKKAHQGIAGYNPCALFRVLNSNNLARVERACRARGLEFINITDEAYDMSDICKDDNHYDVIINKFKITEGIDLRRCHVIYMDSKPGNEATVVQIIGRARRNALFWRNDLDILAPDMVELLKETRRCYVFYNIPETEVATGENGELLYSLCDMVSVESLKPNIEIKVVDGQMANGLRIMELRGKTGVFRVTKDIETGFNVVNNEDFYEPSVETKNKYIVDLSDTNLNIKKIYLRPNILEFFNYNNSRKDWKYDWFKVAFYVFEEVVRNAGRDGEANLDYWRAFLQVDKKDTQIEEKSFNKFRYDEKIRSLRADLFEQLRNPSPELRTRAKEFGQKVPFTLSTETKQIFTTSIYSQKFSTFFLPYIDKVDYLDVSTVEKIAAAIAESNCVRRLGPNRFCVSGHPYSKYILNKGIKSFGAFKKEISLYKGKTLYQKKIEYWKRMLVNVHSFAQLDEYDCRIVDLRTLNSLLSIGLSEEEVKISSKGAFLMKTCSGSDLEDLTTYGIETDGSVTHRSPVTLTLYRDSFLDRYVPYNKNINDRELAIIGPDFMKYVGGKYLEDRAVTSKITQYSKLRVFLQERYSEEIREAGDSLFTGRNDLGFDKKCNSCLGFCVEYFAKIKLFGDEFYKTFIHDAMIEGKTKEITDVVRVRAAMLIYRREMAACYGARLMGIIPSINMQSLLKENYSSFVAKVIELGNKTKDFVLINVFNGMAPKTGEMHDPDLSVNHISALCDFLSDDTILDVKCTSAITSEHVLQVLAYHYLSTKRSDLRINKLIIYEAVTGRSLTIHLRG